MNQHLIVVVCRGNIGRSPFAEMIIDQELHKRNLLQSVRVSSRGVQGTVADPEPVSFPNITYYEDMYKDSKPTLDKFAVDLSAHVSKTIQKSDAAQATLLLAMDNKTQNALLELFPNEAQKVHLLSELVGDSHDILDPEEVSGMGPRREIFTEIHDTLTNGFPELMQMLDDVRQRLRQRD